MNWSTAEARKHLARLLESARSAPQFITNRGRAVGVVLAPEEFEAYAQWRAQQDTPSVASLVGAVREACEAEGYVLDLPARTTRPNPFAEAMDELSG